jgi:hypothetical protein
MSTTVAVSTHPDAALTEPDAQALLPDEVVRAQLKSERVEEPLAAAGAEPPAAFVCELAVQPPQPVTQALPEVKVTITLHGSSAGAATGA